MMMKKIKYLLLLWFAITSITVYAQSNKQATKDTAVTFKVHGECIQCKTRIEDALKTKGVKSAIWNIDTKILSLVYNPAQISLDKIENKIVAVGHDVGNKKAKTSVYNNLPKCCYYRENETQENEAKVDTTKAIHHDSTTKIDTAKKEIVTESTSNLHFIKGVVLEEDKKGSYKPLANASVFWLGTSIGVVTNDIGIFTIQYNGENSRLIVSYTGYKPDTIVVSDINELKIVLAANKQLKEVIVTSKQRSTYLSAIDPIRTQVMTGKELLKAACCNLSESFETNPSVDVTYNDAVTGSKQIQLLGLSGNYTQLTVENLPGPRGIATPLGLNSIAGPWIESIQLTKGVGSVANGFESIAGQINVELKKPENSEKLLANIYQSESGKTDLNLNLSQKINTKWTTALLLHDDFSSNKNLDFNTDGFRDLPTGNLFSLVNRYKFDNSKGFLAQFGVKVLNDKKVGGETAFNPSADKNTTNHYGLGINTERYEAFGKIGYVFPQKKYKSIGLQLAAINHNQHSYFGLTTYNAKQQSIYSNLIYQSIISTTEHKFRTGLSFQYDKYNENFKTVNYKRTEMVSGAFIEYTYTPNTKFSAVVGLRTDYNNLFGVFVTPRLNIRYEPIQGTTIRASAGRGQRTANIFAENTSVFVSARQVNIFTPNTLDAYGLKPEVAWNKGITFDQKFKLFHNAAMLSLDYFRNDFTNQVVVDVEDARQVKFYNLQDKSFSNSLQAELSFEPIKKLDVRVAYRYFDVKTTYGGQLLDRPFISKNRAFLNLDYTINGWKFDYTITYNGKKRIPNTTANPTQYQLEKYSPSFVLMNAQISKTIGNKNPMDIYIGAENLTNYFQQNVIIANSQPFSQYFDASLVWGPVTNRMFYAGWRLKIK
jgi:outer membrane receptor for ferrienterochelin and colicins